MHLKFKYRIFQPIVSFYVYSHIFNQNYGGKNEVHKILEKQPH